MVPSNSILTFNLDEQLEQAEAAAHLADTIEPRAKSAFYDPTTQMIVIHLKDGAVFMFPHHLGQGLAQAKPEDLAAVEVTPSGLGLHWESLDVDLQVPSLLKGIYGTKVWMAHLNSQHS
ncbi:MAG: DUF2442 domain-containing protein [Prochlorotrichaceae cyanobacterium]